MRTVCPNQSSITNLCFRVEHKTVVAVFVDHTSIDHPPCFARHIQQYSIAVLIQDNQALEHHKASQSKHPAMAHVEKILAKRAEEAKAATEAQWDNGAGSLHPDYGAKVARSASTSACMVYHDVISTCHPHLVLPPRSVRSG